MTCSFFAVSDKQIMHLAPSTAIRAQVPFETELGQSLAVNSSGRVPYIAKLLSATSNLILKPSIVLAVVERAANMSSNARVTWRLRKLI